jgi:hypothetical protein
MTPDEAAVARDHEWDAFLLEETGPLWDAAAWLSEAVPSDELDRLARQHRAVTILVAACRQWLAITGPQLAGLMPEKVVTLDGLPAFERRGGTTRKRWQSDDLVRLLVRRGVDPDGTGVVAPEQMGLVDGVVRELTECAPFTASMGWRVSQLKARDIPVDEFCESEPGPLSVQWHEGGNG